MDRERIRAPGGGGGREERREAKGSRQKI